MLGLGLSIPQVAVRGGTYNPARDIFDNGEVEGHLSSDEAYTTSTGTTLAVPTDPVGLILDGRYRLVRGAELVDTLPVGALSLAADAAETQADACTVGQFYEFIVSISDYTSGELQIGTGSQATAANRALVPGANGEFRAIFKATATSLDYRAGAAGFDGTLALSTRAVPGTHAVQSNAALRWLYGRAPKDVRNRVANSNYNGATSGSPGSAPTGFVQFRSDPAFSVYDPDAETLRLNANGGRYFFNIGLPAIPAGAIVLVRVKTEVAVTASFSQILLPQFAGIETSFRDGDDGDFVGAGLSPEIGSKTLYCYMHNTSSSAIASGAILRLGCGTASNISADITFGELQIEFVADTNSLGTDYQKVISALDITEEGVTSHGIYHPNLVDQKMTIDLPAITGGTVIIAGRDGTWVEEGWDYAGGTLDVGPTSIAGLTAGALFAVGDIVEDGIVIADRAMSEAEVTRFIAFAKSRGAKGKLVEGPELVANGTFDTDTTGWTAGAGVTLSAVGGNLRIARGASLNPPSYTEVPTVIGAGYRFRWTYRGRSAASTHYTDVRVGTAISGLQNYRAFDNSASEFSVGERGAVIAAQAATTFVSILIRDGVSGDYIEVDDISLRQLIPEEDL